MVEELQQMEELGVIARQTELTECVSSIVKLVTPRKICIHKDPKDLNQAIKQEHSPPQTVEEEVSCRAKCNVLVCTRC